jgi:hypothetical protein
MNAGLSEQELSDLERNHGGGVGGRPEDGTPITTDCTLRGDKTRTVKCPTCSGKSWNAIIFSCEVHGECTLFSKKIDDVVQCPCPDQVIPRDLTVDLM